MSGAGINACATPIHFNITCTRSLPPKYNATLMQTMPQLVRCRCRCGRGAGRTPAPARIGRHRAQSSVTIFKGQLLMKQAHLLGLAVRPNNSLAMRPINPPHMSPIEYVAAAASDQLGASKLTGVEV